MAFIDVAFKVQPEESTGLALRGLAAVLSEDRGGDVLSGDEDLANLVDFTVRRQRRVVRSTSSAELDGLVDRVEQVLPLQCALH